MDEKTTRIIRARVYVAFAVVAAVLAFVLTGTERRILLAICVVYCLAMSFYNYRKYKQDDNGQK
ncbi:MAG: hypothetical protein II069_01150 [Oscillospiraceae bacterium]|jgi:hypothetical protein|nr:hypothetical protein [Oscillospiraceae bacterium]